MLKRALVAGLLTAGGLTFALSGAHAADPKIVTLNQTACQFIESENGVDHGYSSSKKADCVAINKQSADKRLGEAKVLELEAGPTIFRVTNTDVPYDLGFWVRGKGLSRVSLPSASGGGLKSGVTKDYAIDLKPGTYLYSCPLNTTPDYILEVKG